ncbi:DUF3224 domain-containing protein [Aeromicrobium sp.]|uniref:DUF3224 domain-containing protein n=1 Tax=Aeromicrobium sp. TaxID=1871063 RepID=UPI0030BE726C
MSNQTTGRFMPTGWDESVIEDIDGEGETKNGTYYPSRGVTTAKVIFDYTGDIAGTGVATYLFAYRDSKAGHADIIGYERFTGTIDGQEGSSVFRHTGSYADGAVSAHVEVLPGLGTDGLADLTGAADVSMAGAPPEGGYEFTLTRD